MKLLRAFDIAMHWSPSSKILLGAGMRREITTRSNNPYLILGVPPMSSFRTVQKAFLKLALQHHPDTASSNNADTIPDPSPSASDFIRIRKAFEHIRNAHQKGKLVEDMPGEEDNGDSSQQAAASWTETDFLDYFREQTGVRLTSEQRRELVHLYRTRPKGHYGGHSWELARRLVAEQDAFLRNMQQGGAPPRPMAKGNASRRRDASSFRTEAPTESEGSKLRRKRRR